MDNSDALTNWLTFSGELAKQQREHAALVAGINCQFDSIKQLIAAGQTNSAIEMLDRLHATVKTLVH